MRLGPKGTGQRKRLKQVRCGGLFDKDASVEDSPVDIINAAPIPLRPFIRKTERDASRGEPPRAARTPAPNPNTVAARIRKRRKTPAPDPNSVAARVRKRRRS